MKIAAIIIIIIVFASVGGIGYLAHIQYNTQLAMQDLENQLEIEYLKAEQEIKLLKEKSIIEKLKAEQEEELLQNQIKEGQYEAEVQKMRLEEEQRQQQFAADLKEQELRANIKQAEDDAMALKIKTAADLKEQELQANIKQAEDDAAKALEILTEPLIKDNGDFYITYKENPNSVFELSAKDWIQGESYFERQMQFLNSNFRLPYDVEVVAKECNDVNAYYNPSTKQIIMCYEFLDSVYADFVIYYDNEGIEVTDDFLNLANVDVVDFVFYHEVAHALIDIYRPSVTGMEENVADQFASYIMLEETDFDDTDKVQEAMWIQDIMYNVGTWFFIQANSGGENVYWDVHNLDIQRFYNVSCYAYGNNPEYNLDLITDGWLPQERADNCEYEYSVLKDSWTRILAPYRI